jgi:uncharacterized protein
MLLLRSRGQRVSQRTRHSMQIDHDAHVVVDPPITYINHSCDPNCGVIVRRESEIIEIHTLRRIAAGEELTIDYASFEFEIEFMEGPCQCNSPSCRGQITGYKGLPAERRATLGSYIAEYLREIEAVVPHAEQRPFPAFAHEETAPMQGT